MLCILLLIRIPEYLGYIEMLLLLLLLLLLLMMLNTGNTTCLQGKGRRLVQKTACLSEPMNTDNTQLGINLVTQAANLCYCFTLFSCTAPSSECQQGAPICAGYHCNRHKGRGSFWRSLSGEIVIFVTAFHRR